MKVLELFAGSRSIGKAFEDKGHEVYSIDWDQRFNDIDLYIDIETLTVDMIINNFGIPDILWASPDCTTYSIAGVRFHRSFNKGFSEYAKKSDRINNHLVTLIKELLKLNPRLIYFIENPRGLYRKQSFIKDIPRYTVTYCQYGDFRMKPTDIFTNHSDPKFKLPCKNGDSCHTSAPRGSITGTQGMKSKIDKSKIPAALCSHIVKITEEELK